MRPSARQARAWHLATVVVVAGALVLQLALVVARVGPLLPEEQPGLALRLGRFLSYFTVLSNLLVVVSTVPLVRGVPASPVWRVLRLDALVCIAVTGVVHWFALRPLLDLHGASYVADKLLHVVSPLLLVAGWTVLGPRGALERRDLLPALVFPVSWTAYVLVVGRLSGWYPYPFLDVGERGLLPVLAACGGVAVLLLGLAALALAGDGRLPGLRPAASGTTRRRPTGRT